MAKKKPSDKVVRLLYTLTGGRCYMCNAQVFEEDESGAISYLGHIAHIESSSEGGPRYAKDLSEEDSNLPDNLMLLCQNCHGLIDNKEKEKEFPTDRVKRIRKDASDRYSLLLQDHVVNLSYADLSKIGSMLIKKEEEINNLDDSSYSAISIQNKIEVNELSEKTEEKIRWGLMRVNFVKEVLNLNPDIFTIDRLRRVFVRNYERLRGEGVSGDTLFNELWDHVAGYSLDDSRRAGSLAMLAYFFEICEVFEK
ncbi:MAG: ABC-three component system protein [Candidatus Thorarchaeota archaeon]